jgi:signal peptidase I
MSSAKHIGSFFLDVLETITVALAIFILIYAFAAQPHKVSGHSMMPNFLDGSLILTDKISYQLHPPQRGDVIVFHYPKNPRLDYIKRIIGLPGEKIQIENNQIIIYNDSNPKGFALKEPYIPNDFVTLGKKYLPNGQIETIEPDQYFVMGDNREGSSDSREFGPVEKKHFVGRAFLVYWPLNRIQIIKNPFTQ